VRRPKSTTQYKALSYTVILPEIVLFTVIVLAFTTKNTEIDGRLRRKISLY